MSQLPKHIMVTLIVAVVIGLLGGGAWYWTNSQLQEALSNKQNLESRMNSLARGIYYPNARNVQVLKETVGALEKNIAPLDEKMKTASAVLAPVRGGKNAAGKETGLTGDAWQKLLSGRRQELITLASESKTRLPEDFYLGFQRYRSLVPNGDVTLPLGIELMGTSDIAQILIRAGVKEIKGIKRVIVEQSDAGSDAGEADVLRAKVVTAPTGNYRVYPLEFSFVSTTGSLYRIMNAITATDLFYIIRFLDINNEKTTIPSQSEVMRQGSEAVSNIVPILGQESIEVRMRVDLIDWGAPEKTTEAPAAPAPPTKP